MEKSALFLSIVTPLPLTLKHKQLFTVSEILLKWLSIFSHTEEITFSVAT